MLVTEEQAKGSKWCPMTRFAGKVTLNRGNPGPKARFYNHLFRTFFPRLHSEFRGKFFRCYGSGCMMWRWADKNSQRGYCGLAGTPVGLAGTPVMGDVLSTEMSAANKR
jgi:hypothetical protein